MKKVAIKNTNPSRKSEIIQIFESLGGKNKNNYDGRNLDDYYYINELGIISVFVKTYLIKKEYTCFDSINEYKNSLNILDTSGSMKTEDLNPIYSSKIINYSDI